jgi:hypothetical protein
LEFGFLERQAVVGHVRAIVGKSGSMEIKPQKVRADIGIKWFSGYSLGMCLGSAERQSAGQWDERGSSRPQYGFHE